MATTDLKELALGQFSSLRGMKIQRVIVILFGDNHSVCVCVCVFTESSTAGTLHIYMIVHISPAQEHGKR